MYDSYRDQYGCVEQRRHDAKQEIQECAVVFRLDHVLHWKRSGPQYRCSARLAHGGMAEALSSIFFEEQSKEGMTVKELTFPLDMNDVVTSLETMEGPMRTRLIMNSHRSATFQDIKTEVTAVKQAQSAVMARTGDAMDVDAFTKGSKGAAKVLGRSRTQRTARRMVIELPIVARCKGTATVEGRKETRKATTKGRATRQRSKANATSVARQVTCRRISGPLKRVQSRQEKKPWQRPDATKWQASIGTHRRLEQCSCRKQDHKGRIGIGSCAAVTVIENGADDYPMLQTPGN